MKHEKIQFENYICGSLMGGSILSSPPSLIQLFAANGILTGETHGAMLESPIPVKYYVYRAYLDWLAASETPGSQAPSQSGSSGTSAGRVTWISSAEIINSLNCSDQSKMYPGDAGTNAPCRPAPGTNAPCRPAPGPNAPWGPCLFEFTSALQSGEWGTTKKILNNNHDSLCLAGAGPIGMFYRFPSSMSDYILRSGAEVAAITHGNSRAWMSSALLAYIINRCIYDQGVPGGISDRQGPGLPGRKIYFDPGIGDQQENAFILSNLREEYQPEASKSVSRPADTSCSDLPDLKSIIEDGLSAVSQYFAGDSNLKEFTETIKNSLAENQAPPAKSTATADDAASTLALALQISLKYTNNFSDFALWALSADSSSDSTFGLVSVIAGNILGAQSGLETVLKSLGNISSDSGCSSRGRDPEQTEDSAPDRLQTRQNIILELAGDMVTGCPSKKHDKNKDRVWLTKYMKATACSKETVDIPFWA